MHALRRLTLCVAWIAAIGTPAVYLSLCYGVLLGFAGVMGDQISRGTQLIFWCSLGLYAFWTYWLASARVWRQQSLAHSDGVRLLCCWIVLGGFWAMAGWLDEQYQIAGFVFMLGPLLIVLTVAWLWQLATSRLTRTDRHPFAWMAALTARAKVGDVPGLVCGVAVGLLGVRYAVPRPMSGWGECSIGTAFPWRGVQWPIDDGDPYGVQDGCSHHFIVHVMLCGMLFVVCWIAGLVATGLSKNVRASYGALSAVLTVMLALVVLLIDMLLMRQGPYLSWTTPIVFSAAIIVGAGRAGYLGGSYAERLRSARQGYGT